MTMLRPTRFAGAFASMHIPSLTQSIHNQPTPQIVERSPGITQRLG